MNNDALALIDALLESWNTRWSTVQAIVLFSVSGTLNLAGL